jgi:cytoskeletal protein CcmA (bactofilin family)
MLGKSKTDKTKPEVQETETFRPEPTKSEETWKAPAPKPPASPETRTLIGEHISIKGDIRGEGDLVIEGSVQGSVRLDQYHLTVGPKGKVEAEISAGSVTISGRLTGNIIAVDKVSITKEADFNGEIKAKSISVEDGAYLKAAIELERGSHIKAVPANKQTEQKTSGVEKGSVALKSEADTGK